MLSLVEKYTIKIEIIRYYLFPRFPVLGGFDEYQVIKRDICPKHFLTKLNSLK